MVVGDSWATYEGPAIIKVFHDAGDYDKTILNVGVPGAKVAVFDSPFWLDYGKQFLLDNPSIDTIHFSMGGVDFLAGWHKTDPPEVQQAFFDNIALHIRHVAQELLTVRPTLRVLLTGYDFWNFVEPVAALPGQLCWKAWFETFGQPTPAEINQAMFEMELRLETIADSYDRIDYLRTVGFLQTVYGYPSKGLPPFSIRLPDATLPSPPEAMGSGGTDCVHPSEDGYYLLAEYYYGAYYRARFHPDLALGFSGLLPGVAGAQNVVKAQKLSPDEPAIVHFGFKPSLGALPGCLQSVVGVGETDATVVIWPDALGNGGAKFHLPAELEGRILFTQVVQAGVCLASRVDAAYL